MTNNTMTNKEIIIKKLELCFNLGDIEARQAADLGYNDELVGEIYSLANTIYTDVVNNHFGGDEVMASKCLDLLLMGNDEDAEYLIDIAAE